MASGGYYVATHILMVWKRLAGLAPDQPHGWSFPDELYRPGGYALSAGLNSAYREFLNNVFR